MADTLWADVSEFQAPVNDSYPHNFFAFRSNDGGHQDKNFGLNKRWADAAVASGKIFGYIVYYFYRPGIDGAAVLRSMVGVPNSRMVVMIDMENAGGQVAGNQSLAVNLQFTDLATWLGKSQIQGGGYGGLWQAEKRVIGYGNTFDLDKSWPTKPEGLRLVIADYGANPNYPGKFAHQYSDNLPCAPLVPCDANSADGMAQADLEVMFGWTPVAPPPTTYQKDVDDMIIQEPDGSVLQLIYGGTASYWRPMPANATAKIPTSSLIKDDGTLKALWKVGS